MDPRNRVLDSDPTVFGRSFTPTKIVNGLTVTDKKKQQSSTVEGKIMMHRLRGH